MLVHHLRVGRSIFTVWFLEELGLDYRLRCYDRDASNRAPPELRQAHPLGKSPVIDFGDFTLAESLAIALHLVDTHDTDHRFAPPVSRTAARAKWYQWLVYSEASAFAPLLLKLLLSREAEPRPPLVSAFAEGEVALQLGYMSESLGERPFLLGDALQAPDIGFTYICQMAERLGELGPYPRLQAYLARNLARPAFQRALEKTGG
jgi:glutathione S-transferase